MSAPGGAHDDPERPPNTALVIIDVQNGVMSSAYDRAAVLGNLLTLVDKARAEDVEVVWVQHHSDELPVDSDGWQYVPELVRRASEPLVHKAYGDSFEDTDLEDVLASRRHWAAVRRRRPDRRLHPLDLARRLRPRLRHHVGERCAHDRGPLGVRGSRAPLVIAHTNLYWEHQRAPGRTAATVTAASVDFGL